jgi:hypothetical protein
LRSAYRLGRSLSKQQKARLPGPGSVIASSFTSPIDAVYLAAIFDPIFTACYPSTQRVEQISLLQAILRAFAPPLVTPPPGARLLDVSTLLAKYPNRPVVVFPECTTTNSRGVLPLSPSLAAVPPKTKIFPVSLRYTPVDVVTPLPGTYLSFLWMLLSGPTHGIRVRIAESVSGGGDVGILAASTEATRKSAASPSAVGDVGQNGVSGDAEVAHEDRGLLDQIGESLARLGRVKRVGLGVKEKREFIRIWTKSRRTW